MRIQEPQADEPFLVCHREERSRFDKLKAPSRSWGDVAIHLKFFVDCRSRRASFAMTNLSSLEGAQPVQQAQGPEPVEGLDRRALVTRARDEKTEGEIYGL
jgi:hypothetical protein